MGNPQYLLYQYEWEISLRLKRVNMSFPQAAKGIYENIFKKKMCGSEKPQQNSNNKKRQAKTIFYH